MEVIIATLVLTLLVISAAAVMGPRLRIAAPLILVAAGIAVSFALFAPRVVIDPELILAGVLPPLLYSSAASIPAMNFRREFGAISGLSSASRTRSGGDLSRSATQAERRSCAAAEV
jgi:NhaP-type Na+/H+ or K+/H+ antiporter